MHAWALAPCLLFISVDADVRNEKNILHAQSVNFKKVYCVCVFVSIKKINNLFCCAKYCCGDAEFGEAKDNSNFEVRYMNLSLFSERILRVHKGMIFLFLCSQKVCSFIYAHRNFWSSKWTWKRVTGGREAQKKVNLYRVINFNWNWLSTKATAVAATATDIRLMELVREVHSKKFKYSKSNHLSMGDRIRIKMP